MMMQKVLKRVPPCGYAVIVIQITFFVILYNMDLIMSKNLMHAFRILLFGCLGSWFLYDLLFFFSFNRKYLKIPIMGFFFILYFVLILYHFEVQTRLDYSLLYANRGEILNVHFIRDLFLTMAPGHFIFIGLAAVTVILLELKFKFISGKSISYSWKAWIYTLLGLIFYTVFTNMKYDHLAETNHFFKSIKKYYSYQFPIKDIKEPYPYINTSKPVHSFVKDKDLPHIFILMVESFNGHFVNTKSPEEKEYTPFINSQIKKGLYIENFYGVATQTCKGQLAILCGLLPTFRKKVFTDFYSIKLNCLSHILKDRGYTNLFFKAYNTLRFDRTGRFAKLIEFDHAEAMNEKFITPEDKKHVWGWGLQDDIYYRKFFKYLDNIEAEKIKSPKRLHSRRYFASLLTVSNHVSFDQTPMHLRFHYPKQKNRVQSYANSISATDHFIKEFFKQLNKRDYLKNSIVIITGDHSYPVAEHGNIYSHNTYFDEAFRTPFLLLWPGKVAPQIIKNRAFSQLDIAPSLIDLLGLKVRNHFKGRSFFDKSKKEHILYLNQPYGGNHFITIKYPYKYVLRMEPYSEFGFNLKDDPSESKNILEDSRNQKLFNQLKLTDMTFFHINQFLIESNRVWEE